MSVEIAHVRRNEDFQTDDTFRGAGKGRLDDLRSRPDLAFGRMILEALG